MVQKTRRRVLMAGVLAASGLAVSKIAEALPNGKLTIALVLKSLADPFTVAMSSAAENYQTNIGPTPKNGREGPTVQGRGTVLATLDKDKFTIHGSFAGLSSPATDAHLCTSIVMGGAGPAIGDLTIAQARSGAISGTFTLTPEQVAALKLGRLYVMLNSQSAPKGNLWGWFQPAHVTVGEDVPQMGTWYIPNLLVEPDNSPAGKTKS